MRPFIVYVPDNKVSFFKELIDSLNFKTQEGNIPSELTVAQKKILDQRLEEYEKNPDSYLAWEDLKIELEEAL